MSWSKSLLLSLFALPLFANPSGVNGKAQLSHGDNNTLIVKTEQEKTILKWKDFSIKKGETTHFIQPSEASATLNRVLGGNPSAILGMLQSNGHLYLINPNGILVGDGACINIA